MQYQSGHKSVTVLTWIACKLSQDEKEFIYYMVWHMLLQISVGPPVTTLHFSAWLQTSFKNV